MLKVSKLKAHYHDGVDVPVDFGDAGTAVFTLRATGPETFHRAAEIEAEVRQELNLPVPAELPMRVRTLIARRAQIGTTIKGWPEPIAIDDDGEPLKSHNEDGSLNEAAFLALLEFPPIYSQLQTEIGKLSLYKRADLEGKGPRSSTSLAGT